MSTRPRISPHDTCLLAPLRGRTRRAVIVTEHSAHDAHRAASRTASGRAVVGAVVGFAATALLLLALAAASSLAIGDTPDVLAQRVAFATPLVIITSAATAAFAALRRHSSAPPPAGVAITSLTAREEHELLDALAPDARDLLLRVAASAADPDVARIAVHEAALRIIADDRARIDSAAQARVAAAAEIVRRHFDHPDATDTDTTGIAP